MSGLGPIGHLPVNEDEARDAAAGPRTTIPAWQLIFFSPPRRTPPSRSPRVDDSWRKQAACRGMDVNLFYPEHGECGDPVVQARHVCNTCPVRRQCDEAGADERFGIWAGRSPDERKQIRRAQRRAS